MATSNGQRKTDTLLYKILVGIVWALLGGGASVGGLQIFSPTNVQIQQEASILKEKINLLESNYDSYKKSHATEGKLEKENVSLKLENIKESVNRIENEINEIKTLIREKNNK